MIKVTRHGDQRIRKRQGIKRSGVARMSHLAYDRGSTAFPPAIMRWLYKRIEDQQSETLEKKVYGEYIYIFDEERLITTFRVPRRYLRMLRRCRHRSNGE